jgi:hypothetical protein
MRDGAFFARSRVVCGTERFSRGPALYAGRSVFCEVPRCMRDGALFARSRVVCGTERFSRGPALYAGRSAFREVPRCMRDGALFARSRVVCGTERFLRSPVLFAGPSAVYEVRSRRIHPTPDLSRSRIVVGTPHKQLALKLKRRPRKCSTAWLCDDLFCGVWLYNHMNPFVMYLNLSYQSTL